MDYKVFIPVLISFVLSVILGPLVIPVLRRLKTNNYGYSSAVSILIFAILILFSMVTSRKAKEG